MTLTPATDPDRDPLWDDAELREALWQMTLAEGLPPEHDDRDDDVECATPSDLDRELDDISRAVQRTRASSAEQDLLLHRMLARAFAEPDPWVGPDPTLDPAWVDSRGRSASEVRADRRAMGVRAAAADLGVRVGLTDTHVRQRAHRAQTLSTRLPQLWELCRQGLVAEQNMAYAAQLAASLPDDDADSWANFDSALAACACRLVPGRFRQRARAARERAHSESLSARHVRAAADRRVSIEPTLDGMAELYALIPAVDAAAIDAVVEAHARQLAAGDDEARTLAQIRADVVVALLTRERETAGPRVTASVSLTIPVMTLLGRSDEPATLAGSGPIPLDTAKLWAADAPEWRRVLTDPFTGTVLDVERRAYRVPADLRRLLGLRHPSCVFPGCSRPSKECDIDHRKRWADGGHTSSVNLAPECVRHHPVKDESLWSLEREPDGSLSWTSPTGAHVWVDPPPF